MIVIQIIVKILMCMLGSYIFIQGVRILIWDVKLVLGKEEL